MSINRRDFLKLSGLSATIAVTGVNVSANSSHEGYPDAYGMLVDTTLCLGENCRRCEEACKKKHETSLQDLDLKDNSVFDKRRRTDAKNLTVVNRFDDPREPGEHIFVKHQCMHCVEPACANACFVKAFTKTPEGAVTYNADLCVGCRYCMVACPFDVPAYDFFDPLQPEIRKCDMCYERIKVGEKPACAAVCPEECITFGKRSELIKLAQEKMRTHPNRYHQHLYGEHEVGGTSWMYLAGVDHAQLGFKSDVGTEEYGKLTSGALGLVPLILVAWPLMLSGLHKAAFSREAENEQPHQIDQQGGH